MNVNSSNPSQVVRVEHLQNKREFSELCKGNAEIVFEDNILHHILGPGEKLFKAINTRISI